MISLDSHVLNRETVDRLLKLSDKALNINPENINVLPFDPFDATDDESAVGPGADLSYPEYDDNCIINSIRIGKVKSIIRHLKVNKQKYLYSDVLLISSEITSNTFAYDYYDSAGNGIYQAGNKVTITIPVPDGFDGRKAFPVWSFDSGAFLSLDIWCDKVTLMLNAQKDGNVGVFISQNKDTIKFEITLAVLDGVVKVPSLRIRVMYWESVL